MGVVGKLPGRRAKEAPRHPEVNQEDETTFEPDNYIFAAAFDPRDTLALQLSRHQPGVDRARQPLVEDFDRSECSAGEDRLQLRSDGLYLG